LANLVIDVGNTAVKLGVVENNLLVDKLVDGTATLDEGRAFVARHSALPRAIVSSVRGKDDAPVRTLLGMAPQALALSPATPLPIRNLYATPATLGNDRIAAAVGANFLFPRQNVLVVDAGTAITYDVVSEQGEYRGGNISPGIALRFRALHAFTECLPLCERTDNYPDVGSDTRSAVTAGVLNGVAYEVKANVEQFTLKYPNLKVIFTGGDANFLAKRVKKTIFVYDDLVLIGLNRILEHYAKAN
jgi:type III pantothenate kinase